MFNGRNEDFGIVPIEANASGKPVLSRDDGFPGLFVHEENGYLHDGTAGGIQQIIDRVREGDLAVDPDEHVSRFSFEAFSERILEVIVGSHTDFQRRVRQ